LSSYTPKRLLDPAADAAATPGDQQACLDAEIGALNEQAQRCRRLAEATFNREVNAMLGNMAEGFERTAGELSKRRTA
jgi:hypothetical protein